MSQDVPLLPLSLLPCRVDARWYASACSSNWCDRCPRADATGCGVYSGGWWYSREAEGDMAGEEEKKGDAEMGGASRSRKWREALFCSSGGRSTSSSCMGGRCATMSSRLKGMLQEGGTGGGRPTSRQSYERSVHRKHTHAVNTQRKRAEMASGRHRQDRTGLIAFHSSPLHPWAPSPHSSRAPRTPPPLAPLGVLEQHGAVVGDLRPHLLDHRGVVAARAVLVVLEPDAEVHQLVHAQVRTHRSDLRQRAARLVLHGLGGKGEGRREGRGGKDRVTAWSKPQGMR